MLEEYCDRCGARVGRVVNSGSALRSDQKGKRNIGEIAAFLGKGKEYVVCWACAQHLVSLLTPYFLTTTRN